MSAAERTRLVIGAILTVGVLFALVPPHYWGTLALALKLGSMIGIAALTIRAYMRRRP